MSQPKIAVITTVGGDTGILCDPPIVHPNVDYIAFVGVEQDVVVWQQQHLVKFSTGGGRDELLPIVLPQLFCPNHNYYILVDPNQTVVVDPFELVNKYLSGTPLGLFAHRIHSCIYDVIYDESDVDDIAEVLRQRGGYTAQGFPKQFGFYDLSFVLMRNVPVMLKMCLRWWEQVCRYSALPEISLPYIVWTLGIKPSILPGYVPELVTTGDTKNVIMMRRNRQ